MKKNNELTKEKQNTPIIVANTLWPLPENLIKDIKTERIISGLLDMGGAELDYHDLVGWAELVGYLMPATCVSPLKGDAYEIYLYCVTKYMNRKKIEVPKEVEIKELSSYQIQKLDEFKKFIFKSRGGKESNPVLNALKEVFLN